MKGSDCLVNEIILNETPIRVESYKEEKNEGLYDICVDFKVTSDDYHAMTTLLYEGEFDVKVPEKEWAFRGRIQQYATSITNLYIEGQVGDYHLCLREMRDK